MGKKDKLFCKRDILIIVVTLLASIVLIFFIAEAVKVNEGKEWISLEGWLSYYGSIGGAMFSGFITAIGLYITFRINNKQLEEQRKIDNERWENSNKQFNHQMKIQIINEKINDYKRCIELINQFIQNNDIIYNGIIEYRKNIDIFVWELYYVNEFYRYIDVQRDDENFIKDEVNNKYDVNSKSTLNVFNLSQMEEGFSRNIFKIQEILINIVCITKNEIIKEVEECINKYGDLTVYYKEFINITLERSFGKKYMNYFNNNNKKYNEIVLVNERVDEISSKYLKELDEIKLMLGNINLLICAETSKLYKEKYMFNNN